MKPGLGTACLLTILTVSAVSCAAHEPRQLESTSLRSPDIKTAVDAWIERNRGMQAVIRAANAASDAYHFIADTSIEELRTESGAKAAGALVTLARDAYRHAESYGALVRGASSARDAYHDFPVQEYDVTYSDGAVERRNERFPVWTGYVPVGADLGLASRWLGEAAWLDDEPDVDDTSVAMTLVSSRLKPIVLLSFPYGAPSRVAEWLGPFKQIVQGDRIADIPALVAELKR